MTGSITTYVLVYVDDITITGSHPSAISAFIADLNRTFALKDLGRLSYFLGIEVTYSSNSIHLCQAQYLRDLLHMLECKPISSPVGPIQWPDATDTAMSDLTPYSQIVGSLQYATITRRKSPMRSIRPLVSQYLKGTLSHGLTLAPSRSMNLVAYSDVGWVSDPADLRSQRGFAVFLGNNLIS
ncbi:hypothetical protein V2J09_012595 [Rumex salicifolius]